MVVSMMTGTFRNSGSPLSCHKTSTPSTFADVQVYKFLGREVCDPELGCFIEPLQDLYLVEGYGSIPPDSLKIASDLSSATLNASFIGIEDISGLQKEITIDATFTSTTEPQHIFETTRFTRGSCINTYHTNAAQVDAAISGTVSTNDFTVDVGQLAPNPNFSSAIELMKINQVTLESSKCSS